MKKKFLAVALVATMMFSSVMPVFAETKDYQCAAFASANSGNEELTGDFNVQYTFHVNAYQAGVNTYENVMVEIFTEGIDGITNPDANYLSVVCNGGAWWWNGGNITDDTKKWLSAGSDRLDANNVCTDTEKKVMADADVVLNVQRKGQEIALHADATAADGTTATWDFQAKSDNPLPDKVNIHLSGEQVKVTDLKFSTEGKEVETQSTTSAETQSTTSADQKMKPSVASKDNNQFVVSDTAAEEEGNSNVVIFVVIAVVAVVIIAGVVVVVTKKKK